MFAIKILLPPFVVAAVLAISPIAFAADPSGEFATLGVGNSSCGEVTQKYISRHSNSVYSHMESWVNGYMTAAGHYNPTEKSLGEMADFYARMAWIRNYCLKNPLDKLGKAAHALFKKLRGNAQTSSSSELPFAPASQKGVAEAVFERAWRSVVVIKGEGEQGSGVIITPNVVATNCHVIDNLESIIVYKHDNPRATTDTLFYATIRYRDDDRDLCLLDVDDLQGIPPKVRDYDKLNIGEDVYAVGSPKGLDLSLSTGVISQLRQTTDARYIQTDAAISPGSSGGGLFDSDGNLIGILTRKIADEDVEGIGFAIPADLAFE